MLCSYLGCFKSGLWSGYGNFKGDYWKRWYHRRIGGMYIPPKQFFFSASLLHFFRSTWPNLHRFSSWLFFFRIWQYAMMNEAQSTNYLNLFLVNHQISRDQVKVPHPEQCLYRNLKWHPSKRLWYPARNKKQWRDNTRYTMRPIYQSL